MRDLTCVLSVDPAAATVACILATIMPQMTAAHASSRPAAWDSRQPLMLCAHSPITTMVLLSLFKESIERSNKSVALLPKRAKKSGSNEISAKKTDEFCEKRRRRHHETSTGAETFFQIIP
jgi:hypothetical protein